MADQQTPIDPYKFLNISLNPEGSITRHTSFPTVPASATSPSDPALFKDIPLNPANTTFLRLFLPRNLPPGTKLPVIIYFHGGGFVFFSATSQIFHESSCHLAATVPAIVVSVDYRLAPENRLPAAYEDAADALHWILIKNTKMSGAHFDAYDHLHVSLNPDGTLNRHLHIPEIPTTGNVDTDQLSVHAVVTKDVPLNPVNHTSLRIFRPTKFPSNDSVVAKLPIILFFHGGGWIDFRPSSAMVHSGCESLATELPAVVVSVDFRLAPESRLPAQYDDAVDAIMWVRDQAAGEEREAEEWVREYGDFSRCYLYGTSNGGNIVFNAALRVLDMDLGPVKIAGLIMNQPMFGGVKRTKQELKRGTDQLLPLPAVDLYWELALPPGTDRDHRYSNPLVDGPHKEKLKSLGRCLVIGFNGDLMIDRQQAFVQMLVLKGVQVEARFDDIGFHGIDMVDPRRGVAVLNFIKEFI